MKSDRSCHRLQKAWNNSGNASFKLTKMLHLPRLKAEVFSLLLFSMYSNSLVRNSLFVKIHIRLDLPW